MAQKGIGVQKATEIKRRKNYYQTNLEKVRVDANLSQSGLSKLANVSLRSIQCYEQRIRDINGANLGTLLDLCLALNCTLADILEDKTVVEKLQKVLSIERGNKD